MRRLLALAVAAALLAPTAASADSILFRRDGDVWRMAPDGSGQVRLTSDGEYTWPSAADDGTFVAADAAGNLHRWSATGVRLNVIPVPPVVLAERDERPTTPTHVRISPDGTRIAYDQAINGDVTTIVTASDATTPLVAGQNGYGAPWWLANDRLLLSRDVFVFDEHTLGLARLTLGGSPELWIREAGTPRAFGLAATASRSGDRLAVLAEDAAAAGVPSWTRLRLYEGTRLRCDLKLEADEFWYRSSSPMLSPDGKWLAWAGFDGITVMDLGDLDDCRRIPSRIVTLPDSWEPFWSPYTPAATGPTLTLGVTARERPSERSVRRKGIGVRVTVSEPATVRVRAGGRTVTKRYRDAGTHTVRVHPKTPARRYVVRVTAPGAKPVTATVRPR